MSQTVWAEAPDVPGLICPDAEFKEESQKTDPKESVVGQRGWQIGLQFRSLADLADKLEDVAKKGGQIERLGIHAHGIVGTVFVEGRSQDKKALKAETLTLYAGPLIRIKETTTATATVLFLGCLAGAFSTGDRLFIPLSKIFSGRSVVAFTTIGYVNAERQSRKGMHCSEAGMRDTDNQDTNLDQSKVDARYAPIWNNLARLPWASEKSPHAKVFRNGKKISGPEEGTEVKQSRLVDDHEMMRAWRDVINLREAWDNHHRRHDNERRQAAIGKLKYLIRLRNGAGVSYDATPWNLRANQRYLDEF